MAADLAVIGRLTQRFERLGTSLFIRTFDGVTLVDELELTNVATSFPSNDVMCIAQSIRSRLASVGRGAAILGAPARLASDGNSIIALAGAPVAPTTSLAPTTDASPVTWALAMSERRMRWVENQGVSGHSIATRTAALPTWVPQSTANVLLFLELTNSITAYVALGQSTTQVVASVLADLDTYLGAVRAYHKFQVIYLGTCTPRGVSGSVPDALARNVIHELVNAGVRQRCANQNGLVLVDFHNAIVDRSSATLEALANTVRTDDKLHPTPKGARAMGLACATVWNKTALPNSALRPLSQFNRSMNAASPFTNSNPLMIGTPSAAGLVGGATGLTAPNVRVNKSGTVAAVASVVAAADGIGNAQRAVATAAASGDFIQVLTASGTESSQFYTQGDYLQGVADVRITGMVNVQAIEIVVTAIIGASNLAIAGHSTTVATAAVADFDNTDLTAPFSMSTPAFKFQAGAPGAVFNVSVRVTWGAGGSGTCTLDVTKLGFINHGQVQTEF